MSNLDAALSFRVVNAPAPIQLDDGTLLGPTPKRRQITEDDVVVMLSERDDFVSLAICILYARQRPDERAGHFTKHDNKVGFNKFDADRGAYWGEWVSGRSVRFPDRTPSFVIAGQRLFLLSGSHLSKARVVLHKYRKQLAAAINAL